MKMIRLITVILISITFLFACSDKKNGSAENTRPKVALIMKSLANEFFVKMAKSAEDHHNKNAQKYDLIINGIKNESDLSQQVALVDQMIAMGVKAIVICPADSKALVPALARAKAAGIVIVNIDNRLDADVLSEYKLQIPFIGPSNRDGAKLVADYVLKNAAPDAQVVILEGIPSANNSIQRKLGFEDAVKAAGENIITSQSASWDQTKAIEITSAILQQHPETNVILAANDNMALGAASAVNLAKLNHPVAIAGFDNISAINSQLKDGTIKATIEQHGDQFAIYGIEFALDVLAGKATEMNRETAVDLITADQSAHDLMAH
jgi:ribose transport system substrate-binding protein